MSEPAHGMRVLIAEDSPTQAAMLRAILEEEDFRVGISRDGREAAGLFDREAFDIVLSDIVMPGLDGFELCRQVKRTGPGRHVPVILLTAMDDPMDIARGLEAGADDFVAKPYDPAELIGKIRLLLAAAGAPGAGGPGDRGQMIRLLVGAFEASARKGAELETRTAELADARRRLRSGAGDPAASVAPARVPEVGGIFTLDGAGTVTSVNPAAAGALGWEGNTLCGKKGLAVVLAPSGEGDTPDIASVAGVLGGSPGFAGVEAVFRDRAGGTLAVVHDCWPMTPGPAGLPGVVVAFRVRSESSAITRV